MLMLQYVVFGYPGIRGVFSMTIQTIQPYTNSTCYWRKKMKNNHFDHFNIKMFARLFFEKFISSFKSLWSSFSKWSSKGVRTFQFNNLKRILFIPFLFVISSIISCRTSRQMVVSGLPNNIHLCLPCIKINYNLRILSKCRSMHL